jgi:hypothetical protein
MSQKFIKIHAKIHSVKTIKITIENHLKETIPSINPLNIHKNLP